MVHDYIERALYAFYLRSSLSNPDHKQSIRYFQSDNKPEAAYYFCNIKGEWESPSFQSAGLGVLLMEEKLDSVHQESWQTSL